MLLAIGVWAVYSVLLKRRPAQMPPLALHTMSVAAGTLCMLPSFGWQLAHGSGLPTSHAAWMAIAFVAIFSSALGHALWVRGVATIDVSAKEGLGGLHRGKVDGFGVL